MAEFPVKITSTGGEKVEQQIRDILNGAKATSSEIVALSRSLNTSAKSAATFAAKLGLSVGETQNVINRYRALQQAGLSAAQTSAILSKETGLTAKGFDALQKELADVDRQLEDYVATQKAAAKAQEKTAEMSLIQFQALQQVNMAAQQVAGVLQSFAGRAISEFISYNDALTSVTAKVGDATEELAALEEAAIDVALATSQSPTGAIRAAESLIALGASAAEAATKLETVAQLTDALRSVGADIETSAKVVQLGTSLFSRFGETAESVGDKIAVISDTSAVASSTGLQEFLQLFSKAGGIAGQLGVDLNELLGSFAVLRDAGQAPEVAATSLKSLLSTIVSSEEKLAEFGVEVFRVGEDGQKEFVGLADTFRQIGEAGLDTTELVDLFGKIGIASATALSQGYEKVDMFANNLIDTQGALARKSEIINSSIQGQIKLLEGSVQTALVKLGESIGSFTGPAVAATNTMVKAFVEADPAVQKFIGGIIGIGAALASLVAALTGFILALKAWEAAQVGATISLLQTNAAIIAKTVALNAAAAAGNREAIAAVASAKAAGVQAGAMTGATVSAGALGAALGLLTAAVAAFGAALALTDILKTTQEMRVLGDQIDSLAAGSAATFGASMKVAEGLKGVNAEINRLKQEDAAISDELIEKQRQYMALSEQSLKDIETEIAVRQQLIDQIELGEGKTDVPFLQGMSKDAQEALLNSLRAQQGELVVAARLIQAQVEDAVILSGVTEETTDAQEELNSALEDARNLRQQNLDASEIQALADRTAAYQQFGADKEGLDRRLSEIEKEELNRRLNEQLRYLADLKNATFASEDERKKAIAEGEKELADIKLQQAKAVADEQADVAQELAREQEEAAREAEAEKERLAREAAAEQERIERERIRTEQALREAAFNEQMRQIDEQQRAYELSAIAQTQAQEDILEGLSDQNDALNQQIALLSLAQERSDLITAKRIAGIDQEVEGLQSAEALLKIINDTEASREEKELARKRLRELGISDRLTELQLTQKFLDLEEERRKAEFEALLKKQEADRQILALQQEQERIGLRRQAAEAEINRIKSDQLVIESQLAQLRAQTELANAQANLARLQQEGAPEADLIAAQQDIAAKEQALRLTGDQVALAQEGATVAAEASQDAADALVEYEQIAAAQTQNLTLAQQITLEQEKAADAAERFAAALERAAATNSETKDQLVGTVTPEARRLGGPVSPQGLYRVNEAGVEAFKPLAGGPPVPLTNIPSNGLFKPSVPGRIIPAGLAGAVSGGAGAGAVIKELRALRQEIASRPVSVDMPATFYNEPSPLVTRIQLAQNQIKLSRGV